MKPSINSPTFRDDLGPFINPHKTQVIFAQGQRGSGKSTFSELVAEILFNLGWTVIDLWSASNMESAYWCVDKGCKKFWKQWRIDNKTKLETHQLIEPIHCECNTRHPITLLCPDYIEFDQRRLDIFNEVYYSKEQWIKKIYEDSFGIVEYNRNNPPKNPSPPKQPWLKIKKLPVPTRKVDSPNNKMIEEEFIDAVLDARRNRRIVVFSPKLFPVELHKFKTLEIIIRSLGNLAYKHFQPKTERDLGKTREKWTDLEKSWDKIAILMREFGELTASVLKGENESTLVKKALLNHIRETRHHGVSIIGDFQRNDDVFAGIRDHADIICIKRAPRKLLGDSYKWLFDELDLKREKQFGDVGYYDDSYDLVNRVYPRIEELNFNYGYIIYSNNKFKLWKFSSPNFHHHQEGDHFEVDTGITWKRIDVDEQSVKEVAQTPIEFPKISQEKNLYNFIYQKRNPKRGKPMKWEIIRELLVQEQEKGTLQWKKSFKTTPSNTITQWYNRIEKKFADAA